MTNATESQWEQLTEAGRRHLAQGDDARAEAAFREAIAEAERFGDDSARLASSVECLAQVMYRRQAHAEAEALFRRALALRDAQGPSHAGATMTLNSLAALCSARGAYDDAEAFLARALATAEQEGPSGHRELAGALNALARLHFKRGNYPAVEPLLLRLLAMKQELGHEHPEVAAVLTSLATLRTALGRHDHAEQLLRRAIAIREASGTASAVALATLSGKLADVVAAQGRADEAAAIRARASSVEATMPPRPADVHDRHFVPHAPTPLRGLDVIALPEPAPRAGDSPAALANDGASLFAAAAALALQRFEPARPAPAPARVEPAVPLAQPAAAAGKRVDVAPQSPAAPAAAKPEPPAAKAAAPARPRRRPVVAGRSLTRTQVAAAAMLTAIVLVAGKVAASSTRSSDAAPASEEGAELAYPVELPADSAEYYFRGDEQLEAELDASEERAAAGVVEGDGETSRAAAARSTTRSEERSGRRAAAKPAPRVKVDLNAIDQTLQASAAAVTGGQIVDLPAITKDSGALPPVDGRRFDGRAPR
jgi:tetratricopeptide (TPR) repeat protein